MPNLLDKTVILEILSETEKSEERDRRRDAFDAYQVFSGNQRTYVERQLSHQRPKSWQQYTVSNISVSKMITKKRAQSYSEPPIRSTENQDLLDEIYDLADAERAWQTFDEILNLQKYSMMWINWREEEQMFQFMPLHPYEYSAVRNKDTGALEIVGLNYPNRDITSNARSGDGLSDLLMESQADSSAQGDVWVFWSEDQVVKVVYTSKVEEVDGQEVLKKDITYIPIEGNPNSINPLGILPFIFLSDDLSVDLPTKSPITEQSITFNTQWSEVMTAANIQGVGQFVISYPERLQGKMDKIEIGLASAIELMQVEDADIPSTTAEYISPSPKLNEQKEIAMDYLKQVLKEHGIDVTNMDMSDSNAVSGISRAIAGSSVQKIINHNQMLYSRVEKQVFEVLVRWTNLVNYSGGRFSDGDQLKIIYPKPKVMISDTETLTNIKMKLDMGLIEKWEALVALDPNLTQDEAVEKLERIDSERASNMRSVLGVGVQQEPGIEDDQA